MAYFDCLFGLLFPRILFFQFLGTFLFLEFKFFQILGKKRFRSRVKPNLENEQALSSTCKYQNGAQFVDILAVKVAVLV